MSIMTSCKGNPFAATCNVSIEKDYKVTTVFKSYLLKLTFNVLYVKRDNIYAPSMDFFILKLGNKLI